MKNILDHLYSSFLPANWYFDRGQCWKESTPCGWSNQNILDPIFNSSAPLICKGKINKDSAYTMINIADLSKDY
jgi:hypothetical protein